MVDFVTLNSIALVVQWIECLASNQEMGVRFPPRAQIIYNITAMPRIDYLASESVTEGHPDKICDQISDAILDAYLKQDAKSRVACESFICGNNLIIGGEITSKGKVDAEKLARQVIKGIGYDDEKKGLDYRTVKITVMLNRQSPDIAMGVSKKDLLEQGAGDQGMMYGYACDETKTFMPLPIYLAHALSRRLAEVRKNGLLPFLGPDGKTQVTVEYHDGKPKQIKNILISSQHAPEVSVEKLKKALMEKVIRPIVPKNLIGKETDIFVNPTGRFVIGGPAGDTGLTGRKIIVDTYGGLAKHGGGAFSGKDPSKVDRSAAYAMRWAAKNLVAAGLAKKAEVKIAYAIGMSRPLAFNVNTFGTGKISDNKISDLIGKVFDFRPAAIIRDLDLLRPIYLQTAAYGHFGRTDIDLPWESTSRIKEIQAGF
ncbi:MAG: S-adenosylmethionine synthase [Parcubacteria group bacterium GW2011_GWA2_47_8b]|uniref:S-adenosylmethionine synthase n=2 Tax=Parcubacteria group TaxID=1794811 RepID=A0A0G1W3G6_9BACT|nr:MAG: S-adenosylmethionine synthase [Candidatus Giovannonibacteria bacterium GW2011_GWB1_47_6b]KKU85383.1 MAG: S-adenosylmethionine synthase [Parcubacteria group bacterium GW2011_GWA2_47_8b]